MPTVLIDGSNLWYRAYTSTSLTPPGGPMLIMYNMIKKLAQSFGAENLIICWDSVDYGGRKLLDPNYKANRVPVEGVWDHLHHAKELLSSLGLASALAPGFEADDAIGSLAKSLPGEVLVASYDKDFYQLITDRIKVYHAERKIKGNPQPERTITEVEAIEEFGCPPAKIPLFKAFRGDTSDNIPKLELTFSKKFKAQLLKVINLVNNLEEFYQNLSHFDSDYHTNLLDFKNRALLNYQLLVIRTDIPLDLKSPVLDEALVQSVCQKFKITSIKLSQWKATYKQPENQASYVQKSLFD